VALISSSGKWWSAAVYSLDATYVEWWIRGTLSTCIGSYDAIGGLAEYPQPDDFQFDVEDNLVLVQEHQ
jgi:hypothetical protein